MGKLNSIEKSQFINSKYKGFLKSSFRFGNKRLQELYEQQLQKEKLFKGPYVDLNLPFVRDRNIKQLVKDGVLCESFLKLNGINFDRPLYAHQVDSIKNVGAGRSTIVTTGTGSGKTECFLFPILNEILSEIENGNKEDGIRAIFLYPMNALVNDQMDRVREILKNCPEIKFGYFTGDTKETVSADYRYKYEQENNVYIPSNELVSREEIRKTPPHLLFTNYSMLEYLLIRPNDYSIFSSDKLANWKYVVLDEAHTYNGSLGIELSMLLRRLTGLADKKPKFILTSATLGQKGKSEKDIVNFAQNLTASSFDVNDIIFAKRIPLTNEKLEYTVSGEDYIELSRNSNDNDLVKNIISKYINVSESSMSSMLYDLLIADRNVYKMYTILKNGCKDFSVLLEQYNQAVNSQQLAALIDLINHAQKDGIGIFDLKYHSFVRPLSGAYVTLEEQPQLSLTKTNWLGEYKAFEIGNCRYCSSPYVIGKIYHSERDNLDYLLQNNEIDIYENYGNNEYVALDYFLMENTINEEEVDYGQLDEYIVCAKCGAIHAAKNKNAVKCACGNNFEYSIFRVQKKDTDDYANNNINQCPCCGHKGKNGVVKSLDLGKDEGTSIISQILLDSLGDDEPEAVPVKKLSLKNRPVIKNHDEKKNVKQFLTFSDSRQQASFTAAFFDAKYYRMLRKRLIWKIIEDNNYNAITVNAMAAELKALIKKRDLFPNDLDEQKNAWIAIMVDLLKVDGSYDGEGLGLYYFDLDLSEMMSQISEEDVDESLGKYKINKKDLGTIMQVVFSVFKNAPAIDYTKSTLTEEEKLDALDYRRFDIYIAYNCSKNTAGVRSFLPIKSDDNKAVRYVMKVANCDCDEAKTILDILFNNLAVPGGLLKKHPVEEKYQIDAGKYIIRNYRTSKYYKCTKCGRLTPYNVHNVCVNDRCTGKLVEVNPDEELASNWYRKQYKEFNIEPIVIQEHTAQLDRKKAKQYQQDFKDKKINILSCSTTFEMGIDIGDLETVFMRNVPPSPANYVQRAGRAGRRKDSAAYILTYCGKGSHDYTYFLEPEKMISGIIKPPYFNVVNHKIIERHLMAACLGSFFRKYPDYFKSLESFVLEGGAEEFKKYILEHPQELNYYINNKVLPEDKYDDFHDFKWFDEIKGEDEKLNNFVNTIKEIEKEYANAKKEALAEEKYQEADYYKKQIDKLHKDSMVEMLSRYCVIPKYGFPVDIVELQVYKKGRLDNSKDLSRDLKIAVSEYAPDSEVIADKEKYTSKYITMSNVSELPKHYFAYCPNCEQLNVILTNHSSSKCRYCGTDINIAIFDSYIEPIYGFKTGETKQSAWIKPRRSYSGEVSYIGDGGNKEIHLDIGNVMSVDTSTEDELLVMNKSMFYMCPLCGYSDLHKGKIAPPDLMKKHMNYKNFSCTNDILQKIRLGHTFRTDVARFTIPSLKSVDKLDYSRALSFLYAFIEGISIALGIERTDIDGIIELDAEKGSYDILVYDNVPGGAGHVKRLVDKQAIVESLKAALEKVSQNCCDENTSCYNCLRNYYNQAYHNKLQRKLAKEFIEMILSEI